MRAFQKASLFNGGTALLLFAGTLAFLLLPTNNQVAQAGPQAGSSGKTDRPTGNAKAAAKPPAEERAAPRPRAPVNPSAVLKTWTMPSKPLEKEIDPYGQIRIHDLYLTPEGDLLVTQSEKDIFSLDLKTGRILQTFRPEGRNMLVAPSGRTLAEFVKGGKEIVFRSTSSGAVVGAFRPGKGESFAHHVYEPAFTPDGRELVVAMDTGPGYTFVAVAAGAGPRRTLAGPTKGRFAFHAVNIPLPDRGVFLRHLSNVPSGSPRVSALQLSTGKETALTAIDLDPASLFHLKGIQLSPDGQYLMAKSNAQAQVIDWENNRRLLSLGGDGASLNAVWFTPDGRRVLAVRSSRWERVNLGTGTRTEFPNWIQLYDIASRKQLTECVPAEYGMGSAHALTISGDGKTVVLSYQATVKLFDFQKLFGVAPLKP